MANTQLFKNTSRNVHRKRYITNEDQFSKGMQYTNNPLSGEYAKTIVNFNFKNDGESLVPRGGLRTYADMAVEFDYDADYYNFPFSLHDVSVHHAGSTYIHLHDYSDAVLCNYFLVGYDYKAIPDSDEDCSPLVPSYYNGYILKDTKFIVEYNGKFIIAEYDEEYGRHNPHVPEEAESVFDPWAISLLRRNRCMNIQGFSIKDFERGRDGLYATINGVTYIPFKFITYDDIGDTASGIGNIEAMFTDASKTKIKWCLSRVDPKSVQPVQAINFGYNMLSKDPYSFENVESSTGAIQLTGVVPYDEKGKLLLTARPGTPIVFKLFYKYPASDASDKYKVQWEIQDLNNSSDATVIQKVRKSIEYTPGDEISFTYTPSLKAFSIIVRLYKKSEIAAQDAAWQADTILQKLVTKDENLTPNQVTTLASYYLTSNSDTSMLNINASNYSLETATGICEWQQRMVLWGVSGAESTLFVSEINDPSYFPYPNNCEIFSANIVYVVPYLTALLVFTMDSLYKLTLNDDGLTYKTECIQKRLYMTPDDANTVITVQNMVFFKAKNYFYMVVPNNNNPNSTTGLQIAPISRMIEQLLDNLPTFFTDVLNDVYGLTAKDRHTPIQLELIDYWVYLADTQVKNMYKVKVDYFTGALTEKTVYFDIGLNYDTVLRAWTVHISQANKWRDTVYKSTVTNVQILVHLYNTDLHKTKCNLIEINHQNPEDNIDLGYDEHRLFGNWQYIDTGYRDFQEDLKKRFREVQFCINALSSNLFKFNTAFNVDDADRFSLYKNVLTQCTDRFDPNYGTIFIDRELTDPLEVPTVSELDSWEFDTAQFPDITVYKVRYKVSGKGYGGAVKILSKNEVPYELLHINWVYRIMFAR